VNINEYFNKVYTIAFRLTGEEFQASDMAVHAIERTASKINTSETVPSNMLLHTAKEVCRIFLQESQYKQTHKETKNEPLQNALLTLEPLNRTTIVWKDVLGFKIDDLVLAVDCSKQELYCELNNARMQMKVQMRNFI